MIRMHPQEFYCHAFRATSGQVGRVVVTGDNWRTVAYQSLLERELVTQWSVETDQIARNLWGAMAPDGSVMMAARMVGEVSEDCLATGTRDGFIVTEVSCRAVAIGHNGREFVYLALMPDGVTVRRYAVGHPGFTTCNAPFPGGTVLGLRMFAPGLALDGSQDAREWLEEAPSTEFPAGRPFAERTSRGVTYRFWLEVDGLLLGQVGGRSTELQQLADGARFLACAEEARELSFVGAGGAYLATGWLEGGRAFTAIGPPFEPIVTPAPAPTPPIDPHPRPDEPPADPGGSMAPVLTAAIVATIERFAVREPVPQTPGGGEEHEDRCRAWVERCSQQLRASFPSRMFGCKRASEGRPPSKDALAELVDGRVYIWDLLLGAGTGAPKLIASSLVDEEGIHAVDQVFIPVDPIDHLGEAAPDEDSAPADRPVDPPPARPDTDEAIEELRDAALQLVLELGNVRGAIADVHAIVKDLRGATPPEYVGEFELLGRRMAIVLRPRVPVRA